MECLFFVWGGFWLLGKRAFTDYEKIQNIVDNDSLGETAEKM